MKNKTASAKSILNYLFPGSILLFVLAHFVHHLLTALPVPLLPMIRTNFSLDYTQSGLLISAFSLANGISHVPAGWLADHIDRRIMITAGLCGIAFFGFMAGLSQTYVMMLVFLVLMGLMAGGYHTAAPPMISASVSEDSQGRALGVHMIGGSMSYFLAPLFAAAIAVIWGWRGSFITLAIPTFAFGIIFYKLIGHLKYAKKTEPEKITGDRKPSSAPRRIQRLIAFIVLSSFTMAVYISVRSFIPLYLVDNLGMSEEAAASFVAFIHVSGLWAGPLGGYLSDRFGRIPVILLACFIAGPAIYMLNVATFGVGMAVLLMILGMIVYVRIPVSEAFIVNETSERNRSTILGIYLFSSSEAGGVLTPLMGYFIDNLGFNTSFTIASVSVIVMTLICSVWLLRIRS